MNTIPLAVRNITPSIEAQKKREYFNLGLILGHAIYIGPCAKGGLCSAGQYCVPTKMS